MHPTTNRHSLHLLAAGAAAAALAVAGCGGAGAPIPVYAASGDVTGLVPTIR